MPERSGHLNRERFLAEMKNTGRVWDLIIIGGGATGLGIAVDAAARGYKTILLEQADFAKGTSSRSTKLIHGGVRYLAQGNVKLVYEALRERRILLRNAPHLVTLKSFLIPCYTWWQGLFYGAGLKVYDGLAGSLQYGHTSWISKEEVINRSPNLQSKGLKGGILYIDGQFDDSRLAINLAQTSGELGGVLLNYFKVTNLLKNEAGQLTGVLALDVENGNAYRLQAKAVINATGVFAGSILQLDEPRQSTFIRPSQGVHLVVKRTFLPSDTALMIPKTPDGRVLFAVPWHGHVLLGTTDTPVTTANLEPQAYETEIAFILKTVSQYLTRKPTRQDVLSVFAGLRPLAAMGASMQTKEISRGHKITTAPSGLITVIGGKWTIYRKMAEETVDKAITVAGLPFANCITADLKIHGYLSESVPETGPLTVYGSDAPAIRELIREKPDLGETLHPEFPYLAAQVVWAARHEMARTVEDVLARRLRILFLDARAAIQMAPVVANLLAEEFKLPDDWKQKQLTDFITLANGYILR